MSYYLWQYADNMIRQEIQHARSESNRTGKNYN